MPITTSRPIKKITPTVPPRTFSISFSLGRSIAGRIDISTLNGDAALAGSNALSAEGFA